MFKPQRIPSRLERELPFASKTKLLKARSKPTYETKRAVVLDGKEREVAAMFRRVNTMKNVRAAKEKAKKREKAATLLKKRKAEDDLREKRAKQARKEVFRMQGLQQHGSKRRKTGE